MTAQDIRRAYLDFFVARGHVVILRVPGWSTVKAACTAQDVEEGRQTDCLSE